MAANDRTPGDWPGVPDLDEADFAQIKTLLDELRAQEIVAYVLPTEPLGEEWVLGIYDDAGESHITKFSSEQAVAFIAGVGSATRRIARAQGVLPELRR